MLSFIIFFIILFLFHLICRFELAIHIRIFAVVNTPSMLRIIYELAVPDGRFQLAKYNPKPGPRAKQDPAQMLFFLKKVGGAEGGVLQ